jgi:hypothetical protein
MPQMARALALVLLSSLLVLGFGLSSPVGASEAKPETHPEWGRTIRGDGFLKRSCRNYPYRYELTPPDGLWALETFLIGPGGDALASGAFAIDQNPASGPATFRFCRPSTRPGVFKIRALLSVQDEVGEDYQSGWLPVTKFRLRLRR